MADTVLLKADLREESGSKHAVRLRKQGKLPAIVYGHGKDSIGISVDFHDFVKLF